MATLQACYHKNLWTSCLMRWAIQAMQDPNTDYWHGLGGWGKFMFCQQMLGVAIAIEKQWMDEPEVGYNSSGSKAI